MLSYFVKTLIRDNMIVQYLTDSKTLAVGLGYSNFAFKLTEHYGYYDSLWIHTNQFSATFTQHDVEYLKKIYPEYFI